MKDKFIHEHPLITTATALGVGLLAPVGVKILAQQSTKWREGQDTEPAEPRADDGDAFDKEYIYRHPFITTGAALGAIALAPVGLNLLEQLQALWSDDAVSHKAQPETPSAQRPRGDAPPRPEPDSGDGDASDQDFMQQHPFMTTAAALGVGLLAPIGLNLMAQMQAARTEAAEADVKEREPARAKSQQRPTPPLSASARPGDDDGAPDDSGARQRAFMTNAAALGVGLLGALTLASQLRRPPETEEEPEPGGPQRGKLPTEPQRGRAAQRRAADRRAYDVGALDMEMTAHRPSGKDVELSFGWKKRPVDAPETDWPTDNMGFTVNRPDGKNTTFKMARKSRPVPAGYGDVIRRGLGQAALEFVSNRPDGGAFRFTWEKIPPDTATEADEEPAGQPCGREEEPAKEADRTKQEQKTSEKPASG